MEKNDGTWQSTSVEKSLLSLEALMVFLTSAVDAATDYHHQHHHRTTLTTGDTMTDDDLRTTITRLRKTKQRKHLLSEGAERFNISPKNGIAFLTSSNLLSQTPTPTDIVTFLMTTPSLSKRLIGEYLASPKHVELLGVFMTRFRFEGRRVDEGLRLLLESFRLPGEAQQIDRIMETFSKAYFQANDGRGDGVLGVPKNADSVYVLSFAIIMLNTDHHNSQIKVPSYFFFHLMVILNDALSLLNHQL